MAYPLEQARYSLMEGHPNMGEEHGPQQEQGEKFITVAFLEEWVGQQFPTSA